MAKILIVDDRPTNRQFLRTLLSYENHELTEAADGEEALERTRAHRPDLVITDILMPKMSGYEFVQQVRADPELQATPVIFYTATYSEPQARQLGRACNVLAVLPKPCDPQIILHAVHQALHLADPPVVTEAARQRIALANLEVSLTEDMLAGDLYRIQAIKMGFETLIERSTAVPAELETMRDLSGQLSKTIAKLTLMTSRLGAVVQLGLDLMTERDAVRLVQSCFDAACSVVGSTYAAIKMTDGDRESGNHIFTKNIDEDLYRSRGGGKAALLTALMSSTHPVRLKSDGSETLPGLAETHPPIRNFLGVPITSANHYYGWMYFADRVGAEEFSSEDERLATTLASQLGILHENIALYSSLAEHAVQLQLEVTERQRAQSEILQLNESLERRIAERTAALEAANTELEAFTFSVSHDLRAPLSTIQGFSQLLEQQSSNTLTDNARRFLIHITGAARRMTELIDALLRLSNTGRQPLRLRLLDLTALAHTVVADLRTEQPDRIIDVHIGQLPPCQADAPLLKQALTNLCANAFKFTRHTPNARVAVDWRQRNGHIVYFVADNGAGFDMRYATKLFGAFQRSHTQAQFEGTGIGLSIVKRIITPPWR